MSSSSGESDSLNKRKRGQLSHALIGFADCLIPSDQFNREGNDLVQAVVNDLRGLPRDKFRIGRMYYDGSIGKKTSVIHADFDCVAFINNREPPLDDVLQLFEKFVKGNAKTFKIDESTIHKKRVACSFEFRNGVEVDLLPACNFAIDKEEQRREVLRRISEDPDFGNIFLSSSLVEQQIDFIKQQSSVTHQLIRLAKYWFKSLHLDKNIFGGSFLMEILGVAVSFESQYESIDMIERFKRLLQKVHAWRKLRIAFIRNDNHEWKLLKEGEFKQFKDNFRIDIVTTPHFIIKPSNPYQDMSKNVPPQIAEKLERFAGDMLERITKLESPCSNEIKTLTDNPWQVIHFNKLFEPFPMCLQDEYYSSVIPTEVLLQYEYKFDSPNCKIDELKPKVFEGEEGAAKRNVAKCILNTLLFLVRGHAKEDKGKEMYPNGYPNLTKESVRQAVQAFVKANRSRRFQFSEAWVGLQHMLYDATLLVPYCIDSTVYAVRVSLRY